MNQKQKTKNQSLGDAARDYVRRKFGEHEAGSIILSHESLRYIICGFTMEWLSLRSSDKQQEVE
jgi:hypothetical protein